MRINYTRSCYTGEVYEADTGGRIKVERRLPQPPELNEAFAAEEEEMTHE